jgi:hypothetical protein
MRDFSLPIEQRWFVAVTRAVFCHMADIERGGDECLPQKIVIDGPCPSPKMSA